MNIPTPFKKILFYWISSFILATIGYYVLWIIMPGHRVFGSWYRMIMYHMGHPLGFISIPCIIYGILATLFDTRMCVQNKNKQLLWTLIIVVLTILISSPFGGMLWHYYDMRVGYFPADWQSVLVKQGAIWGLELGWLILLLSFPYNVLGVIACHLLTKKGCALFNKG